MRCEGKKREERDVDLGVTCFECSKEAGLQRGLERVREKMVFYMTDEQHPAYLRL